MGGGDSTVTSRIEGVMTSVAVKAPCAAMAAAPIVLSGLQTIDGVALAQTYPPTRCLVIGQADQTTNGIYDVSASKWLRSVDFDGPNDAVNGTYVNVVGGTLYAGSFWQLSCADAPIIFGTSELLWIALNSGPFAAVGTVAAFSTTANLLTAYGSAVVVKDGTVVRTVGRTVEGTGGADFWYNSADTTTADNGGTIRVDAQGRRWYALKGTYDSLVDLFGAMGDALTNDTPAINNAATFTALRGGKVTFGSKVYLLAGAGLTCSTGVTFEGTAAPFGQFVNGTDPGKGTVLLDTTNNNTVTMAALVARITGIIFATPQPIFSTSINTSGHVTAVSARWSGMNLTPGIYPLTFTGGFGSGAAGTCTVDPDGKVRTCTITNGGAGYYYAPAGPIGVPLVTATITGGNQKGAFIVGAGDDLQIDNCAFIGKEFQILSTNGLVRKTATASFGPDHGSSTISVDQTGLSVGQFIYDVTNPRSFRKANYIAILAAQVDTEFAIDEDSQTAADQLLFFGLAYFVRFVIEKCHFWGSDIMQIFAGIGAENFTIRQTNHFCPSNGAIYVQGALATTLDDLNIDGVYAPRAIALHMTNPPAFINAVEVGNVPGDANSAAIGIYMAGRATSVPFIPMEGTMQGCRVYAPCAIGLMLEGVQGGTFISNAINCSMGTGNFSVVTDTDTEGNTVLHGWDALGAGLKWSLGSQRNWILGPAGWQKPSRTVTGAVGVDAFDHTIFYNAAGGGFAITGPDNTTSLAPISNGTGLEYELIRIGSDTNAVTWNVTDSVNGAAVSTPFALPTGVGKKTTIRRGAGAAWWAS